MKLEDIKSKNAVLRNRRSAEEIFIFKRVCSQVLV